MEVCDAPKCPAKAEYLIIIDGRDLEFCMHHYMEYQVELAKAGAFVYRKKAGRMVDTH